MKLTLANTSYKFAPICIMPIAAIIVSTSAHAIEFETIRSSIEDMTDLEEKSYFKSLKGERVDWTGWVDDVTEQMWGGYKLLINMDNPNSSLPVEDVYIENLDENVAAKFKKNQQIYFSGNIQSITNILSVAVTVENARFHNNVQPSAETQQQTEAATEAQRQAEEQRQMAVAEAERQAAEEQGQMAAAEAERQAEEQQQNIENPQTYDPIPLTPLLEKMIAIASNNGGIDQISDLYALKQQINKLPKPARGDKKAARKANKNGLAASNISQFSLANQYFIEAYNANPADAEIINNLGFSYIKLGDINQASKFFVTALMLAPERTAAWNDLARVYAQKNQPQEAVACFALAFIFSKNQNKNRELLQAIAQGVEHPNVRQAAQQALQLSLMQNTTNYSATKPDVTETSQIHYVAGLNPNGDNFLSLREGPNKNSTELHRMTSGTLLQVLEYQGKWAYVKLLEKGVTGWARSNWIKCCKN